MFSKLLEDKTTPIEAFSIKHGTPLTLKYNEAGKLLTKTPPFIKGIPLQAQPNIVVEGRVIPIIKTNKAILEFYTIPTKDPVILPLNVFHKELIDSETGAITDYLEAHNDINEFFFKKGEILVHKEPESFPTLRDLIDQLYTKGTPCISDEEYDNYFPSTTGSVGVREGESEHHYPILSLKDYFSIEAVQKKCRKFRSIHLILTPKIDGVALVIEYRNGEIYKVLTRGNGLIGREIKNYHLIKDIPLTIPKGHVEPFIVRGEIYIPKTSFQEDWGSNARNVAAGALSADDERMEHRDLHFIAHEFMGNRFPYGKGLIFLKDYPFKLVAYTTIENKPDKIDQALKSNDRDSFSYEIDGLVIVPIDPTDRLLGENSKFPNWKIAYKFKGITATGVLERIEWQVGLNFITPVAILKEAVPLLGSMVQKITLHNYANVKRMGFRENCNVILTKAGDIIPAVVSINGGGNLIEIPQTCNRCGSSLEVIGKDETHLSCPNQTCPAKLESRTKRIVDKKHLNWKGISVKMISRLIETGAIKTQFDVLKLTVLDLVNVGISETYANKLIGAPKTITIAIMLSALNIPTIGLTITNKLTMDKNFNYMDPFNNKVKGIGVESFKKMTEWWSVEENKNLWKNEIIPLMKDLGVI